MIKACRTLRIELCEDAINQILELKTMSKRHQVCQKFFVTVIEMLREKHAELVWSSAINKMRQSNGRRNAGEDRLLGKMSVEEGLVERDVLDRDCPLVALQLDHPVDQQKGVTVRQQVLLAAVVLRC